MVSIHVRSIGETGYGNPRPATSSARTVPVSVDDQVLPASRQPMPGPPPPDQLPQKTPEEIEQELLDTARRLRSRVDELVYRVSPRQLTRRGVSTLRAKIVAADGRPKPEVVGAAVGALVGLAFLVWRSRRRR
jgi:hypothetical protein